MVGLITVDNVLEASVPENCVVASLRRGPPIRASPQNDSSP
jgi:hypothetical protein